MDINLTGVWDSDDYECPYGTKHTERVSISHSGEDLIAIKITGDDCVPAGFETFRGRLPSGSQVAAITWTAGQPKEPASATLPGFLKIIDRDHFRAGNSHWNDMIFVRSDD
jgi:hypothetical protein